MELVYLWVEDYKNIQKQGFNFSPRFRCEYDYEKNELNIIDKEETGEFYPKNFFGDNINVTTIVGENGSGKSSIFKSIFDFKTNDELKDKKKTHSNSLLNQILIEYIINVDIFLIYFDNSKNKYFYYSNNDYLILSINEKEISIKNRKKIKDLKGFYLNYARDILLHNNKQNSTLTLNEQTLQLLMKYDNFYTFYNKEFIFTKMIIKIHRDKLFRKEFENNEYKEFLNSLKEKILNIIEKELPKREYLGALKNYEKEYHLDYKSSKNLFIDLKLTFITSFFNNLVNLFSNSENIKREFIQNNESYFDNLTIDNMIEKFSDFNEKIHQHNLHYEQNKNLLESFKELIKNFETNKIDKFSKLISPKNLEDTEAFILEFDIHKDNRILKKILKQILKFSHTNENDLMNMFLIDFKNFDGTVNFKQLSDGEKAIFELFTKILYRIIFLNEKTLFLDEPETFLHPNWSKELINLLIKVINNLKLKDLNIIITSHSPFILSDIPKENVIFLEKYKENDEEVKNENQKVGNCKNVSKDIELNTFGANIHTLLSNGFFMSEGLMGEFAKEKIQSIINYHEELLKKELTKEENKNQRENEKKIYEKEHKTNFRQIQSIIGDDYLKQVIKNHLVEIEKILYDEYLIDKEIKKLEDEIERLKGLKK
ncbi:AAA family ATPase [Aliarcobacter cryaerophilus]|uniref:AAA family ATPase n=1 Tax=Aliarcobacter cryaerophilus TaxID=28198 RepID=UPI003BB1E730